MPTTNVLAIGGSDSSAGAGIQADLKAIHANGGYGLTVITAVTAQNAHRISGVHEVPASLVVAQIEAIFEAFPIHAIKTGMLPSRTCVTAVVSALRGYVDDVPLVVDPVMVASSGSTLMDSDVVDLLHEDLLPMAKVITPNALEASVLTDLNVTNPEQAKVAGSALLASGCSAVVVKGGHFDSQKGTDVLITRDQSFLLPCLEQFTDSAHGTGCTFAAALSLFLGKGSGLLQAVREAKAYLAAVMTKPLRPNAGKSAIDHFYRAREQRGD